jgi:hypothetical protein
MVPGIEEEYYPSLGHALARWMEANLVHGPGDLRGEPLRLDEEKKALLCRLYEVYPPQHPQAGRRRFRRGCLNLRKGVAKTEFAACIAAAELHPSAPVRCTGWAAFSEPIGGGVTDPYIPLIAYTEEQSDELAYAALCVALGEGPLRADFDIGLQRIMRKHGDGRAVSLAAAPDSRDGALTTFELFDESHRLVQPRQKQAVRTMLANLPKRRRADAWALETTTMFAPGEGSVAEDTYEYAMAVNDGRASDARLFFFHRRASDGYDLTDREQLRAAVEEASGPAKSWSDIDGIVEQWDDPTADTTYLERVWLNRPVQASMKAFDAELWKTHAHPHPVPDGEWISLGFDGSRTQDATGLIATHIASGYQWVIGAWERPHNAPPDWGVPEDEVHTAVAEAFKRWKVWRLYADPPYWETEVDKWAGQYGGEKVVRWYTRLETKMAMAIQSYLRAMGNGEIDHDGDAMFARHIGNACRRKVAVWDDAESKGQLGQQLFVITKERSGSPFKIDLAVAAVLSWEARRDALASGISFGRRSAYEDHRLVVV